MADSADDLLARARQARQEWLESACIQDGCLEEADAAYAVLDTWLSSGGPLPTAWAGCAPAQPVTDVPLTDQISIKVIEDDRMPPGAAAMIGADGQIVAITGLGDPGGPDIAADVREAQHRIEAGEIADTW